MPDVERHRALNRAGNRARKAAVDALVSENRGEYEAWYRFECLAEGVEPKVTVRWVQEMSDTEVREWAEAKIVARIAELRGLLRATIRDEVAGLEAMLDAGRAGDATGGAGRDLAP